MKTQLVLTKDGSHTLYVESLNEHYHSTHGAVNESLHVYLKNGLLYILDNKNYDTINVLEVGFGTGLNTLLTAIESENYGFPINYTTLDIHPLEESIINSLNYSLLLEDNTNKMLFNKIHNIAWNIKQNLRDNFLLEKQLISLQDFKSIIKYDLIYFDAFAPRVQPELWTVEIFKQLYNLLSNDGVLVTYCAKGEVKRNFLKAGFIVQTLDGPPGKREMIRAVKNSVNY